MRARIAQRLAARAEANARLVKLPLEDFLRLPRRERRRRLQRARADAPNPLAADR